MTVKPYATRLGLLLGLTLALLFLVRRSDADCAESVQALTLELTSLESLDGASAEQLAAEQARLNEESVLVGDYESKYRLEETVLWERARADGGVALLRKEDK